MFQSQANSIIQKGQIEAKAYSESQRMNKIQFYLDYANNICRNYIEEIIDGLLADVESRKELKKYIEPDYTVERILDETNILFTDNPEITPAISKENETDYNNAKLYLDEALENINFYPMLDELEKKVSLCRDIAIIPNVIGNDIILSLVAGNIALVEQAENPTKFKRFIYFVEQKENTITSERVDIVNFWELIKNNWIKFEAEIDINGQIIERTIKELDTIKYPKELCPVILVRDYYPSHNFWYEGNNPVVEKAISIDVKYTDLAMAEAYNVPQLVRTGVGEGDNTIKNGRMFSHDIIDSGLGREGRDIKYINPNENLKDALELIISRYTRLALKEGLSLSTITGDTATSGYHLALSMTKIIQRNNRKRKYYTKAIKSIISVIGYLRKKLGYKFRDDIDYNIDYAELKITTSGAEQEKENALALANNTKNLIDLELEKNPDLNGNREKALEIIKKRVAENTEISSNLEAFRQEL